MTTIVLGIPSAFSAWGFEVVRRLVKASRPATELRLVDRYDQFDEDPDADVIVCSQFPSRSLREAAQKPRTRLVVFAADSLAAVSFQRRRQPKLVEALRTVGASAALISDCRPQKRALFLDAAGLTSAELATQLIADHIDCPIPADFAETLASLGPIPTEDATGSSLTEADKGIVALVLDNATAHLRDAGVPLKSIWPHRVFFSGDRPNEEAPLVVDATGGSRVLYYGPYFHLSEGRWRAKLTVGFTKEAAGLPFKISAFGPDLLGEARLRPRQEGIFSAQFSFLVSEPERPVEFHIRTEEGAIEGRVALAQAELSHLGDKPPAD